MLQRGRRVLQDIAWGVAWSLMVATVFTVIAVGMYIVGLLPNHSLLWLFRVIVGYYAGGALGGALVGLARPVIPHYYWLSYAIAGGGAFLMGFVGMLLLEGRPSRWEAWVWWGLALVSAGYGYLGGRDLRRGVRWENLRRDGRLETEEKRRRTRRLFRSWAARDE
jgi:hypothetical protein